MGYELQMVFLRILNPVYIFMYYIMVWLFNVSFSFRKFLSVPQSHSSAYSSFYF
jgi:hypothetical protein